MMSQIQAPQEALVAKSPLLGAPSEVLCEIIGHVHEFDDLIALSQVSSHLRAMVFSAPPTILSSITRDLVTLLALTARAPVAKPPQKQWRMRGAVPWSFMVEDYRKNPTLAMYNTGFVQWAWNWPCRGGRVWSGLGFQILHHMRHGPVEARFFMWWPPSRWLTLWVWDDAAEKWLKIGRFVDGMVLVPINPFWIDAPPPDDYVPPNGIAGDGFEFRVPAMRVPFLTFFIDRMKRRQSSVAAGASLGDMGLGSAQE